MPRRYFWILAAGCVWSLSMPGAALAGAICSLSGGGTAPTASGQSALACGYSAEASGDGSTSIGTGAGRVATGTQNVAVGYLAGNGVPGSRNTATGAGIGGFAGLEAGAGSFVDGDDNSAYGFIAGRFVTGSGNSAFGSEAGTDVIGDNNIAVGTGAGRNVSANDTISIGRDAVAGHDNAVAIGAGAATTRADQVAIGTGASTYTLAGVASGASSAAQSGDTFLLTSDAAGNLAAAPISAGQIAALDGRVGGMESRLARLSDDIGATRTEARQGVAAAIAMAYSPMPSQAGKTSWATNIGHFKGETAFGLSFAHRLDVDVPMALSAGYSFGGGSSHGFRVGLMGEF